MTHKDLRWLSLRITLAMFALAFIVSCSAVKNPDNPQQAMVEARASFIAATGLFTVYATQPWCGDAGAPKEPLCADRQIVKDGARAARAVDTALDAADEVIAAKGVPDMSVIVALLTQFQDIITKARGG